MLSVKNTSSWNTFDSVRDQMEHQFDNVAYVPETGLAPDMLHKAVSDFLANNSAMSRQLQKAHVYRIVVTWGCIAVDAADWFADKLQHGNLVRSIRNQWVKEMEMQDEPFATAWRDQGEETGYMHAVLDLGHCSPGWGTLFRYGLCGLLEQARISRESHGISLTKEQADFYDSLEIVYRATISFAGRLADLAENMIPDNPGHGDRLSTVASSLRHVPANPPRDLHEALQFAYLMHQLVEMEGEWVRSMGGFDKLFLQYYQSDIASGRLTREQAKELIKFFWSKFFANTKGRNNGKNFYFGGQYPDGTPIANELSAAALEAYGELSTTDPKLSVRLTENTPEWFFQKVADMIRKGQTSFVLINDEVAVPMIMKRGKTVEDARSFLLIGCYEPAVEELEIACTTSGCVNLAKLVELVLHNGKDPMTGHQLGLPTGKPEDFADFEGFYNAYMKQLDFAVAQITNYLRAVERHWPRVNPSPVLAGTYMDCIRKGCDIGSGGPKYNNTGVLGNALANAADSIMAVKQLVFEEKRCTLAEMAEITANNFEGHGELLLRALNRVPKWGNGNDKVDSIACEIARRFTAHMNAEPNLRGGTFQAALYSVQYRFSQGKMTGALPDGRLERTYLAGAVNATTGMDKKGITAQMRSVTKLDYSNIPNGSVFEVYLHPSAVQGEEGLHAFMTLIKTYFACGGFAIQFNIFDTETLKDAQIHPEQHATLQVRVCGWNVYFTSMSEFEQNQYIEANKHILY